MELAPAAGMVPAAMCPELLDSGQFFESEDLPLECAGGSRTL